MASLTRWVLAHKKTVVLGWILLAIAGMAAAGPASNALDPEFSVPGKEGWETNVDIAARYQGTGGDASPLLPVVTLPKGESVDSPRVKADLANLGARLERALPDARTASYASTGDRGFVSDDGHTTFAIVYPKPDPDSTFGDNPRAGEGRKAALRRLDGRRGPGPPDRLRRAIRSSRAAAATAPVCCSRPCSAALGALLVLASSSRPSSRLCRSMMAIASIMTTLPAAARPDRAHRVSPIVQFLVALVGLGVAIDYSLLVVSRWREERAHGRTGDEAVQRAMETAGRAVVFSGITVAIGLFALIALPLPFLRSMGYGGMLIPLVSTLVALTLLPVILAKPGRRLDWPHRRTDDKASRAWTRWAQASRAAALGRRRRRDGGRAGPRSRRDRPAARDRRRQHVAKSGRRQDRG